MNEVLVSRSDLLPAGFILPANNNIISRAEIAGNKARVYIPLYPEIEVGHEVSIEVWTDGEWIMLARRLVTSIDKMIEVPLLDKLFANPVTRAIVSYVVNGNNHSEKQEYTVED